MKNTERIRLLYQNDCAFNMGIIVGKKEMIEKACEWMMKFKIANGEFPLYDYVGNFRKAMEE